MWNQRTSNEYNPYPSYLPPKKADGSLWGPSGQSYEGTRGATQGNSIGQYTGGYFTRNNDPNFEPSRQSTQLSMNSSNKDRKVVVGYRADGENTAQARSKYEAPNYQSGKNGHWGDAFSKEIIREEPKPQAPVHPPASTQIPNDQSSYAGYKSEPDWYHRQSHLVESTQTPQIDRLYQDPIKLGGGYNNPGTKR
jgi:hypothetical protein